MDKPDTSWPDLPYAPSRDTAETLQLWTQIVGKIRLTLTPWLNHNHGWQVPLYVTAPGPAPRRSQPAVRQTLRAPSDAPRPPQRVPAMVSFRNPKPTPSLGGRSWSLCRGFRMTAPS